MPHDLLTEELLLLRNNKCETALMTSMRESNLLVFFNILKSKACTYNVLAAHDGEFNNIIMIAAKEGLAPQLKELLDHPNCPKDALSPGIDKLVCAMPLPGMLTNTSTLELHHVNRPTNALSLAVIKGDVECIELIINHRLFSQAILFERDWFNSNAIEYAESYIRSEILILFQSLL